MIVMIDSGGANISSVRFALERLGIDAMLTRDAATIKAAEKVILPGVGAAPEAMRKLEAYGLADCIRALTQPVLGICLGMQLLFDRSEEGDVPMLGIIPAPVRKFTPAPNKTIPHMGWNNVHGTSHPLLADIPQNSYFYFVHSYCAPVGAHTVGSCNYGEDFSAIVAHGNFIGCQFHPERSGKAGAQLLKNFVGLAS